jgi:hypothetical protein
LFWVKSPLPSVLREPVSVVFESEGNAVRSCPSDLLVWGILGSSRKLLIASTLGNWIGVKPPVLISGVFETINHKNSAAKSLKLTW